MVFKKQTVLEGLEKQLTEQREKRLNKINIWSIISQFLLIAAVVFFNLPKFIVPVLIWDNPSLTPVGIFVQHPAFLWSVGFMIIWILGIAMLLFLETKLEDIDRNIYYKKLRRLKGLD